MSLNKICTFLILFFTLHAAASKDYILDAKTSYEKGDYKKAIEVYESIVTSGKESAGLYYNLGNAYYKNNDIGLAILNYEKAKKLNSKDEDLLTNLKIANQRIEDKIEAAPELFLNQWKRAVFNLMNEKEWSVFLILLFSLALFLIAVYLISSNKTIRQLGFYGGTLLLILSVISYFICANKYQDTIHSKEAIIILPSSNVNASPSEKGTKIFILHEGTKVKINEESGEWTEIKLANDNVGWIKSSALQTI